MLDAKTISATLTIALLGCGGGDKSVDQPNGDAPPTDTAAATSEPLQEPPAGTAEPTAASTATPAPTGVASVEVQPASAALPMGRQEPLPPKDGKKVAAPDKSKRTGAASCCGAGTCGDCAPLPAGRKEPKAAKDGKVMPASKSTRKGQESCCGAGTCGPC